MDKPDSRDAIGDEFLRKKTQAILFKRLFKIIDDLVEIRLNNETGNHPDDTRMSELSKLNTKTLDNEMHHILSNELDNQQRRKFFMLCRVDLAYHPGNYQLTLPDSPISQRNADKMYFLELMIDNLEEHYLF